MLPEGAAVGSAEVQPRPDAQVPAAQVLNARAPTENRTCVIDVTAR